MRLNDVLRACLLVAGKDDLRYYLNSVMIRVVKDDEYTPDKVVVCAADGHKIALLELDPDWKDIKATNRAPRDVIIDREVVETVLKIAGKKGDIQFVVSDTKSHFIVDGLNIPVKPVEARYPDLYRTVDGRRNETLGHSYTVQAPYMKQVAEFIIALKTATFQTVSVEIRGDAIHYAPGLTKGSELQRCSLVLMTCRDKQKEAA